MFLIRKTVFFIDNNKKHKKKKIRRLQNWGKLFEGKPEIFNSWKNIFKFQKIETKQLKQ